MFGAQISRRPLHRDWLTHSCLAPHTDRDKVSGPHLALQIVFNRKISRFNRKLSRFDRKIAPCEDRAISSASHFVGQTEQTSELICSHMLLGAGYAALYSPTIISVIDAFLVMFVSRAVSAFWDVGISPRFHGGAASVSSVVAPSITSNSIAPPSEIHHFKYKSIIFQCKIHHFKCKFRYHVSNIAQRVG